MSRAKDRILEGPHYRTRGCSQRVGVTQACPGEEDKAEEHCRGDIQGRELLKLDLATREPRGAWTEQFQESERTSHTTLD